MFLSPSYQIPNTKYQSGQTLIETIVAIFVLVMALTTGLGLAVYAFSSSSTSQNQIVAENLAREGIEVVRMMRDSNWLAGDSKGLGWGLQSCADIGGKQCYPKAFEAVASYNDYNLLNGNHRAIFNTANKRWSLDNLTDYNLTLRADGIYANNWEPNAKFARVINISFNPPDAVTPSNPPKVYTFQNPEMIVKSVVAWRGKNCPSFPKDQDLLLLTKCRVILEDHMTNWKDYK